MELNLELIQEGLKILAENHNAIDDMGLLPNAPTKTMGGAVFWNELAKYNGWCVQKNMITQHCRILDPENKRRAWGGEKASTDFFQRLLKN